MKFATAFGSVWCIHQAAFERMCVAMTAGLPRVDNPDRGILWAAGGKSRQQKSVAVMQLYGVIDKRQGFMLDTFGGTSTDTFGAVFDSLVSDTSVKGIVIDSDTPGGSAIGTPELAKKIYDARGSKPIVAVSNSEMNSAGFWIGSAAHKVFVTPSSYTGSIGVWSAAAEYSKAMEESGVAVHVWRSSGSPYKAEFLPWKEFTKEAIENEQQEVDRVYDEFISAVAKHRGKSVADAQKSFGMGRTLNGKAAVAAGLADRVATLDEVVTRILDGRLTLGSMERLDEAWEGAPALDESWKDANETERLRSQLRVSGVLAGSN